MQPRALHLVPKLPPVGLQPAPEHEARHGEAFTSEEISSLQLALAESPSGSTTCPRCGTLIDHEAGEEHPASHMTTWSINCLQCGAHAVVRASLYDSPAPPRFSTLVASKVGSHRVRRTAPGFATSTLVHVVLIGLAARYTLGSGVASVEALSDTTLVYLTQEPEEVSEPEPEETPPQTVVIQLNQVAKGFQTVAAPIEIPTSIPPVDLSQRFDPRDYSGSGVEGGIFEGVEGGDMLINDETALTKIFKEAVVDEPPERISGPPLRYPTMLRQAGISGIVVLEFVVGVDGKAEEGSFNVVEASNVAFVGAARDLIVRSTFRPGRVRGVAVRVLVTQRIAFNIIN